MLRLQKKVSIFQKCNTYQSDLILQKRRKRLKESIIMMTMTNTNIKDMIILTMNTKTKSTRSKRGQALIPPPTHQALRKIRTRKRNMMKNMTSLVTRSLWIRESLSNLRMTSSMQLCKMTVTLCSTKVSTILLSMQSGLPIPIKKDLLLIN